MKHTAKRWTAWIVCTVILITTLVIPTAAAETITDEGWTQIAHIAHRSGCSSTQGMAVGDEYMYSFMIGANDTKTIVHRVRIEDGDADIMRNGDTQETYFTNLGHANDADVAVIDGVEYLYVLVNDHIEVFEVDGNTLYQRATYNLFYNEKPFGVGGFAVYKVDEKKHHLPVQMVE